MEQRKSFSTFRIKEKEFCQKDMCFIEARFSILTTPSKKYQFKTQAQITLAFVCYTISSWRWIRLMTIYIIINSTALRILMPLQLMMKLMHEPENLLIFDSNSLYVRNRGIIQVNHDYERWLLNLKIILVVYFIFLVVHGNTLKQMLLLLSLYYLNCKICLVAIIWIAFWILQ